MMRPKTDTSGAATENVREFITRLKEVLLRILRSLRRILGTQEAAGQTSASSLILVKSIDALVLQAFVRGVVKYVKMHNRRILPILKF